MHFPESWICNPHTPVQSKHTFSFSRFGRKSDPKSLPKAPQNRPKSIKNRSSSPCQNSCRKSCHTKRKKCQQVSKKGSQNGSKTTQFSFLNLRGSLFFGLFLVSSTTDREKWPQVPKMIQKGWPKAPKRCKKDGRPRQNRGYISLQGGLPGAAGE